jgi:nucleoside-triphosphatase THEP1
VTAPATPTIAAVIGPRGSGKTTVVERIVAALAAAGWRLGGVTQPGEGKPPQRSGYRLRDAASGEEVAFARRGDDGFVFAADGWRWAGARIAAAMDGADCVVVDELGRLEARGQGHLASLELPSRPLLLLVAVRTEHAAAIATRLGAFNLTLRAPASASAIETFAAAIATRLASR